MAANAAPGAVDQLANDLNNTSLNGSEAKAPAVDTGVTAAADDAAAPTPTTPSSHDPPILSSLSLSRHRPSDFSSSHELFH
jgi:polyadenylate-binding protein